MIRLSGFLLVICIIINSCRPYQQEVELKSVGAFQATKVEDNILFLEIELTLYNPNAYSFKVHDADLDVFLNDQKLGKARLGEPFRIPKKSTETHRVQIQAELGDALKNQFPGFLFAALTNTMQVRVNGEVTGSAFLVRRSFPVDMKEKINLCDFQLNAP